MTFFELCIVFANKYIEKKKEIYFKHKPNQKLNNNFFLLHMKDYYHFTLINEFFFDQRFIVFF
jgi:hypothetical protein